MAAMLEFRTQGFNPHAVKYSPYYDSRIAVASAANFGIVGNGRLYSLCLTAQGIQVEKTYVIVLSKGDGPQSDPVIESAVFLTTVRPSVSLQLRYQ